MKTHKDLDVWNYSIDLVTELYQITAKFPKEETYGLSSQMRRAAVSIPSNIAEGDELESDKQSVKYFYIAKASSAELLTQLIIGNEIGYIEKSESEDLINKCRVISVMLTKLIRARRM